MKNIITAFQLGLVLLMFACNTNDEFEVTEIQKIRQRDNTFLVSGVFNIVFSDDRVGIPANEKLETKILRNGAFSVIVEPTDL